MAQTRPAGSTTATTRVKVLRAVWETGWPGAAPARPWSDRHFADVFTSDAAGFWSRATFGLVSLEFDIGPWTVLAGGAQSDLMADRAAIVAACRRQAERDHVPVEGYDHVIAFVHEPPSDTGVCGHDLVLDQTVPRWTRHRQIGRLLGFPRALGPTGRPDDPYCVMGAGRGGLSAATLHRHTSGAGAPTIHTGPGTTVTLTALSEPDDGPVLAVIPARDGRITVEYRTNSGDDTDLRTAVVVHSQHDRSPSVSFETAMDPVPGATATVLDIRVTVRETQAAPPTITLDLTTA